MKPLIIFTLVFSTAYLPVSNAGAVDQLLNDYAADNRTAFTIDLAVSLSTKRGLSL